MKNEKVGASHFANVSVVGLGYIGLPTAAFIASKGVRVFGVDVNPVYVDEINNGITPFVEPGFDALLKDVISKRLLTASSEHVQADAYIVCVPTPFKENHEVDAKYILSAAEGIAPHLQFGALVVLESTSPPGTTELLAQKLIDLRPDLSLDEGNENSIYVAHCPERVLPGKIMEEMANNDRVIGGLNPTATQMATELYRTFVSAEILQTNARTAEMAKLTENSFRDVNIAFANELSLICKKLDINVWELIELANHHPRVNILQPGPGVGGHCIAVDPWFIVSAAPNEARLIRTAREVNDAKPGFVLAQIEEAISHVEDPVIAAFGISFKPDIDDLRESPSLDIVDMLARKYPHLAIKVVEPNIEGLPAELEAYENVQKVSVEGALAQSNIAVLLVDHKEFLTIPAESLQGKIAIDTRGVWRGV